MSFTDDLNHLIPDDFRDCEVIIIDGLSPIFSEPQGIISKRLEEKSVEKKCGTCWNFPSNTALKRAHCDACDGLSQWAPQIRNREEKKMDSNESRVTVVGVQFSSSSREYSFKTDLALEVGDQVVVDTSTGGATLAVVSSIDGNYGRATRWVVQKVDMKAHRERIAREAKLLSLKQKMAVRREQLEDVNIYAQLAQQDPKMFELWNEYCSTQMQK